MKPGTCADDGANCFPEDWAFALTNWSVDDFYGIARDGHIIMGPYKSAGELWACEDLDMCNGYTDADDLSYRYASTTFFPYMVGCWGPAYATHEFLPTCTTNGCGSAAIAGMSFSVSALGVVILNVLF